MDSFKENEQCTVTWKIENFGHSSKSKGERLQSPGFRALSKEWCLFIYPRGKSDSRYITVELFNLFYKVAGVDCKFSILDSEESPLVWNNIKNESSGNLLVDLVALDDVFGPRRASFLPENILTLEVQISKHGEESTMPTVVSFCTRLKENQHSIQWKIPNFNALEQGSKMFKCFLSMTEHNSFLNFELFLKDDQIQFNVIRDKGNAADWAFCSCKVMMLDANERKVKFAESEYFFEDSEKVWQFTAYITKSMLMSDPDLYLPKGSLSLIIKATHSGGIEYNQEVETLESSYVIV